MKVKNLSATVLFICLFFLAPPAFSGPPYADVGDGGPATEATLTLVDGVAVDRAGNIYIAHRSKNRIRKVTPDGVITTVAGNGIADYSGDGGPAVLAALNFPAGLAVDAAGNLYIADRNNHRVRRVDGEGVITTVAGDGDADMKGDGGPATQASLNLPSGLALDAAGNLYIADRSNNRVRRVNPEGIIETVAGVGLAEFGGDFGPATGAYLKYPFGVATDGAGNLYIADRGNNRVRRVDAEGTITTFAGDGTHSFSGDYGPASQASLAYPTGVAVDASGNVFIADRNNNRVRRVDAQGVITTFMGTRDTEYNGDNEIAVETHLHLPFALAVTPEGDLIVADRNHHRVRRVSADGGAVKTVAGSGRALFKGDGGPGRGATLGAPTGIVIDPSGRVLFTEKNHNRIRALAPDGLISTFAGTSTLGNEGDGGPALAATLYMPSEMTIDQSGNVYFASRQGNGWVVRRIAPDGVISRFAGNGVQGGEGDGGPALEASFHTITDIATDRKGNVYISDMINRNIRVIGTDGIIREVAGRAVLSPLGEEVHINGLAVDDGGSIYFSDSGSSKVRKIDPSGNITTVGGSGELEDSGDGGPALQAGIRSPGGLALSPMGELYIAEAGTSRIRKIDANGIITTVAGTGEGGFSGDGGPASEARIKSPQRMVFDGAGNLYFSDRDNNRIRKIDPSGIITTVAGHGNFGWMQDGLEVRIMIQDFP